MEPDQKGSGQIAGGSGSARRGPAMSPKAPFLDLLHRALEHGGFEVDDVLRVILPLYRQVQATHEESRVAPLRGLESLTLDGGGALIFDPALAAKPRIARERVEQLQAPAS